MYNWKIYNWKIGAAAATLLTMTAIVPVAARPFAMSGTDSGATISDETIAKAGAAFKRVSEISGAYSPRLAAAPTPDERVHLISEELVAATTAVSDQGLTVDQYNNVMETAQSDPGVKERLLRATNGID